MLKHICIMEHKTYGGSWGVGDTQEAAKKKARSELGSRPAKTHFRTAEVPDGHHLEFRETILGLSWMTVEPDKEPAATV